jgi:hypothetical protein
MIFAKQYCIVTRLSSVEGQRHRRYDTIRYDTIRDDTIRYDTIRYDTIRYDTIRYDTIRYDTMQYDTIRYDAIRQRESRELLLFCKLNKDGSSIVSVILTVSHRNFDRHRLSIRHSQIFRLKRAFAIPYPRLDFI